MKNDLVIQLFFNGDRQALLEKAGLKKLGLPEDASEEAQVQRYLSIEAYHKLRESITEHANYVDGLGNQSTSKGGFAIQINKRIKQVFNKGVGDIVTEQEIRTLKSIREAIAIAIENGEQMGKSRKEIKQRVYEIIEEIYNAYMGTDYWRQAV